MLARLNLFTENCTKILNIMYYSVFISENWHGGYLSLSSLAEQVIQNLAFMRYGFIVFYHFL